MKPRHGERGTALAEFAIVSSAALVLIFGTIDFGRALYTYHLVSEGARLGSRYAIVRGATACAGGTPDPMQSYVRSQSPGIDPNLLTVTTSCAITNSCQSVGVPAGCVVTVTVSYPFSFTVPLTQNPTMTSSSQMVIAQ